jgi:hypothetical protein
VVGIVHWEGDIEGFLCGTGGGASVWERGGVLAVLMVDCANNGGCSGSFLDGVMVIGDGGVGGGTAVCLCEGPTVCL